MKMAIGAALLAGLPAMASAQHTAVPAIAQASATAAASVTTSAPSDNLSSANAGAAKTATSTPPATTPPPINLLSPSAQLNAKEKQAVALARFLYGATLPTVVCAPLQVCDLALQPGEIVNSVNVGDKVRWNISPGVSGSADGRVTHLIIKPADAGLVSSLVIETDRRTYAIKLVSTQHEWMPLVAFNYPDDLQRQWSAYQQTAVFGTAASRLPTGENVANLDFGFRLSGDDPRWRPLRVYSDGAKTYIQFPRTLSSGTAPALVALDNDGGWFSSPT
jgi:type IV secretion system protein VirB9